MAIRPTNLRATLRASQAAEEGAPRLAMRTAADRDRFVAEALARPTGWGDTYQFRIPGDVVNVGIGRSFDRRNAQNIEWHFQSSKDAEKQFDALYNEHPDVQTAAQIDPGTYSWHPQANYDARMEAYRLRKSAERDVADALGLEGRPSLYGRIEPLPPAEVTRLIRRVGAVIGADAAAFGPRSYRWQPTSDSRAKLYKSMVADLPGYKFSPRDKFSVPGAVRTAGAPKPTGDWATRPGQRANVKDLPILAVPATAAVGAGALAMQPGEAEAAQPVAPPALARAVARQLVKDVGVRRREAQGGLGYRIGQVATALAQSAVEDPFAFFDPTMGFATAVRDDVKTDMDAARARKTSETLRRAMLRSAPQVKRGAFSGRDTE